MKDAMAVRCGEAFETLRLKATAIVRVLGRTDIAWGAGERDVFTARCERIQRAMHRLLNKAEFNGWVI